MNTLKQFASDQSGTTVVEYATVAGLISIMVLTFGKLGFSLTQNFIRIETLMGSLPGQ